MMGQGTRYPLRDSAHGLCLRGPAAQERRFMHITEHYQCMNRILDIMRATMDAIREDALKQDTQAEKGGHLMSTLSAHHIQEVSLLYISIQRIHCQSFHGPGTLLGVCLPGPIYHLHSCLFIHNSTGSVKGPRCPHEDILSVWNF